MHSNRKFCILGKVGNCLSITGLFTKKDKIVTNEESVRGDMIKKSFDELNIFGPALKQAMVDYIERRGNPLDDEHYYTLKEIRIELSDIFGEDAASLLVERLRRGIDALKSFYVAIAPAAGLFLLSCNV